MVVWSSSTAGASRLKMLYLLSIAASTRTLDIQSPYFLTDESTAWAIEQAVPRGVRIRILVEGDITDARPVKYASRALNDSLLALGVQVYEYEPTMMHTKAVVADSLWSIIGSANFDNRSFELNDELNIGVSDAGLARRLTTDFEADLRDARRLTLEEWRRRPMLDKIREHFWSYFGEVF